LRVLWALKYRYPATQLVVALTTTATTAIKFARRRSLSARSINARPRQVISNAAAETTATQVGTNNCANSYTP